MVEGSLVDRTHRGDEYGSITTGQVEPCQDRERAITSLFRNRWWMVFATICGVLVGAGPINVFTYSVF